MISGKRMISATICAFVFAGGAFADLSNPGFDAGLTDWVHEGAVSLAFDGDNYALFQEAGGPGSPAASSLYQVFEIGSLDRSLSFEYALAATGSFNPIDPNTLPDAFTASLLHRDTLEPLVSTADVSDFFYHDARGESDSIDFDPALVEISSVASRAGWFTVTVDLSSIAAGTPARLQFDLLGTGLADGQTTVVGVDGISIFVIPAPPAIVLGLIGLGMVRTLRSKFS